MSARFDLAQLLHPLSCHQYEDGERRPVVLKRDDEAFYQGVRTGADRDAFIAPGNARHPAIRWTEGGAFIPTACIRDVRYGADGLQGIA